SERLDVEIVERERLFERGGSRSADRARSLASADEPRGEEGGDLVDLSPREEASRELSASLDEDLRDAALAELLEEIVEVEPIGLLGEDEGLEPPRAHRIGSLRRHARRRDVEPRPGSIVGREKTELERQTSCSIEDDAKRPSPARGSRRQERVIVEKGLGAGDDRIDSSAQAMARASRRLPRDPLRLAARRRDSSVEAHRPLEEDPRATGADPVAVGSVEPPGFAPQKAGGDLDSCRTESLRAFSVRHRVRIGARVDRALDAGGDDRVAARRCLTVMRARLERDVERRAARGFARIANRLDLRVRPAVTAMEPATDDAAATYDDGADERIGRNALDALARELDRFSHRMLVGLGERPARSAAPLALLRARAHVAFARRFPKSVTDVARSISTS